MSTSPNLKFISSRMFTVIMIGAVICWSGPNVCEAAASARTLVLKENQAHYRIMDYLEFIEDPGGKLTIDEVAAESNRMRFAPRTGRKRHFGFSNSVFWARLRLDNRSTQNQWLILVHRFYTQTIDHIDLYRPMPEGGFRQYRDGESVPGPQTMVPEFNYPAFNLNLPSGKQETLFFRIQDEALLFLFMEIYSYPPTAFHLELFIWCFLLGAFGFFFLHNLLIYGALRDSIFLYFAMVLVGFPLTALITEIHFLTPDLPVWWANRIKDQCTLYLVFTWLLLTKSYYQIDHRAPPFNRWLRGLLLCCLTLAPAYFVIPYAWALQAKAWLGIVTMIFSVTLSIHYHFKGFKAGRFYLLATTFPTLSICGNFLDILGIMPVSLFYDFRLFFTFFITMDLLLFSLALIDRHNILAKEMLAAQQSAVQSMRQAEAAKDEFLANTSHELRTPLAGIIGLTEDLLAHCDTSAAADGKHQLHVILHSARRLSALIDDILDATRIRQGTLRLSVKPVDFISILKLSTALCRPLADPKKIIIRIDIADELPLIMADEDRLQQILINLIKNAVTFTPRGRIHITAGVDGNYLQVAVRDTGIGIAEDQQAAIFERFTQLDGGMERTQGGAGLGLAITRQLVELQGGRIMVESSPGNGACFSFTLPLAAENIQAVSETREVETTGTAQTALPPILLPDPPAEKQQNTEGPHILIIDDEQISRHVLNTHLSSAGYKVTSAGDAFEADALLKATAFDLVVLDIMMPRKNGYVFCTDIRRHLNPTELPVIMLTARSRTEDLAQGFDCGANDYLTKPVNRIELLARVKTSLTLKTLTDLFRENNVLKEEILRRKGAEQQLNAANRQLVGLLNLWEAVLLLVDQRGQILYFNQRAEEIFGYPPHDILNRPLSMIFPSQLDLISQGNPFHNPAELPSGKIDSRHHRITALTADDEPLDLEVIITPIIINNKVVYALICRQASSQEEAALQSDKTTSEILVRHQKKIQAMQGAFDNALAYLKQEGRQLRSELGRIDRSMTEVYARMPEGELDLHFRKALVELMTSALSCWQDGTGGDKVTLAEKSGIWRTYLDGATYKTRTLDKYLHLDNLPKYPRVGEVLNTAEFVLKCTPESLPAHKKVSTSFARLKVIMHVKNQR